MKLTSSYFAFVDNKLSSSARPIWARLNACLLDLHGILPPLIQVEIGYGTPPPGGPAFTFVFLTFMAFTSFPYDFRQRIYG